MTETFRPLQDFEGLYEVSDRGRIRSIARTVTQTLNGTTFTRFLKERFLKLTTNSHGYYQFKPCRNGKTTTLKVARRVEGYAAVVKGNMYQAYAAGSLSHSCITQSGISPETY
jgi:hypothetical protein